MPRARADDVRKLCDSSARMMCAGCASGGVAPRERKRRNFRVADPRVRSVRNESPQRTIGAALRREGGRGT
ncbi:MAG: hypothetical protein FJ256_07705 [Phycisphaerae bacterium]|nr:hypothetical protein [Phycisphaerae bacterium]